MTESESYRYLNASNHVNAVTEVLVSAIPSNHTKEATWRYSGFVEKSERAETDIMQDKMCVVFIEFK